MSKTNDTSKPVALDDQLDDRSALADSELGVVNGGTTPILGSGRRWLPPSPGVG